MLYVVFRYLNNVVLSVKMLVCGVLVGTLSEHCENYRQIWFAPLMTTCLCCDTMGPLVGVTGLPNTGTASLGTNRNTQSGYLLQSWTPVRSYLSSCSLCGRGRAIETIVQNT